MRIGWAIVAAMALASGAPAAPSPVATGTFTAGGIAKRAELQIDRKQRARLRLTEIRTGKSRTYPLLRPDDVLPLLIDKRLAFLWPALTEWAGPDLVPLRHRMLAESDASFAKGKAVDPRIKAMFVNGRAAAFVDRATTLAAAGRSEEGIALLERAMADWTPKGSWLREEQGMLALNHAALLMADDRIDEAEQRLVAFEAQATTRAEQLNIVATLGMLQANFGKSADALASADRFAAMYASYSKTVGGALATVPGSQRYVAVIRGCALWGLGRREEARAQFSAFEGGTDPPSLLHEVSPTVEFRRRAAFCTEDADALASALADSLSEAPIDATVAALLNPHIRGRVAKPELLAAAHAKPAYATVARDIVRDVPDELVPASNAWRD